MQERSSGNGRGQRVRLLAVDLDGTLLNSQSEISSANLRALTEASEQGVQVVVVTGRRFHSALPFVRQIACPVTIISSNGARIGTPSGEVLYHDFLPSRMAQQVLKIAHEFRAYAVAMFDIPGRGQVILHTDAVEEGPLGWYLRSAPECLAQVADFEMAIAAAGLDPIQVLFGGPPQRISPIEPLLNHSELAPQVQLSWTLYPTRNTYLLDVMNRGCSKGRALALWASRLGIAPGEVIAFGDNYNDFDMLEFAGYPVLMNNHCPGLEPAHWLRTLSNDEDGVAVAIRRFVLS